MGNSNVELKRLQQCELNMFKEFIEICEKHHLKYFLLGGTLLGAVRHKGFIPWDDDIDVGMPREDYEKFLTLAQRHLSEHYFLQTFVTDPDFPLNFAKIRDNRTTFIENSVKNIKMNHGIYIDVFPLDYYPDDKLRQAQFDLANRMLTMRILKVFSLPIEVTGGRFKVMMRNIVSMILNIAYPTVRSAVEKRDKLIKRNGISSLLANFSGAWGKKEICPSEWFGEGSTHEFEGLQVKGPLRYHEYLERLYGDYMQPPPPEKRRGHHYADVIDCDAPYTFYLNGK